MAVLSELRREALILALLGILLGLPVTQLSQLQQETFQQPFLVAGFLVSIKGGLNTALAPLIGGRVDRGGHLDLWLLISVALPMAPFAAMLLTSRCSKETQVLAFSFVDTLLGLSGPAMCLCFTLVPQRTAKLTEGYALLNFALSSGLGLGAALGALLGFGAAGGAAGLAAGAAAVAAAWPAAAREARGAPDTAGAENGGEVMKILKENETLRLLSVVVFLDFLAEQMLVSLLLLYLESRFHFTAVYLACELLLVGLSASFSLLFVVPKLQKSMGDLALMRLGMVANTISVAFFGIVWQPWQVFLPPLGCILAFAVFPTANSLASASAAPTQAATAQGLISGARTLAEGVSPVLFGGLFQVAQRSSYPGWPFLVAGLCVALGTAVSYYMPGPDAGDLLLGGRNLVQLSPWGRAKRHADRIGWPPWNRQRRLSQVVKRLLERGKRYPS
ncbi:unnamed protein product [Cladocopium goreaui]|uniref:Major facilitator superfamily (MFS) profile domain-containing protein n=1 Tax=Cladocopium goreaui TaxID=2562237 RepID=A0A9P1G4U6_9DINO|nr:unnamed protein product [Cladocopium goreaui]